MANNYYERGDRLNVYLAAELPEEMTGEQDTWHICGKCAWYSFRKQECICGKTGKEVAYFATKDCFTTEKDTTMEENTNAQPVAETGDQVCKECRAEKIRIGMATGKEKKAKVDIPEKIAKAVSAPSPASEAVLEEAVKKEGVEIAQLGRYLIEFRMAGLALWGNMPEKEEDIDHIIKAEWTVPFCRDIFAAAAEIQRDGEYAVPILVERRLGYVGQKFVDDLSDAFYLLAMNYDAEDLPVKTPVVIQNAADFSDAALLEELRRRGYKGTITKVQEVEI